MRLDKLLSSDGLLSRKEAGKAIRGGAVTVNGKTVLSPSSHIDPQNDSVEYSGKQILWSQNSYIMLNKPGGYISSTENSDNTVMKLVGPSAERKGMFPCGRLDIDTEGLLIITDDGALAHELLSPKHHVEKEYFFICSKPLTDSAAKALETGIELKDFTSKPAAVNLDPSGTKGTITITEGKYHQIKRMFHAVSNNIEYLKRIRFGPITLDEKLSPGSWRYLTDEETDSLKNYKEQN